MKTASSAAEPSARKWRVFRPRDCFWLLLLVAMVVFLPFQFDKRLKTENFGKIQVGMTYAQVADLLGGVPGDYRMGAQTVTFRSISIGPGFANHTISEVWYDDQTEIEVVFLSSTDTVYSCKMKSSPIRWSEVMDRWAKSWGRAYVRLGGMLLR